MSVTINGTGNTITPVTVNTTGSVNGITPQSSNMQPHNLIINGDMRIDQRNGGSAITLNDWTAYVADRMRFGARPSTGTATVQQVADAPEGFYYSAKISRLTGSAGTSNYYNFLTKIEGNDIAHSGIGTSSAQDITISFWVKSNLTGTWSVGLQNEAGSGDRRSYNTEYTINSASVWEYKTVTIPLLQSGVWYYDNRAGLQLQFDLGSGSDYTNTTLNQWQSANIIASANAVRFFETAGATWQITGIQLELGSTASPFAHENYGDTLQKCQRYCQRLSYTNFPAFRSISQGVGALQANLTWLVETRDIPSVTVLSSSDDNGGTLVAIQQSKNSSRFYTTSNANAGAVYQGGAELLVTSEL